MVLRSLTQQSKIDGKALSLCFFGDDVCVRRLCVLQRGIAGQGLISFYSKRYIYFRLTALVYLCMAYISCYLSDAVRMIKKEKCIGVNIEFQE